MWATDQPTLRIGLGTGPGEAHVFEPRAIQAPARTVVAVDFANPSALDHNLVFVDPIAARTREIAASGSTDSFQFQTPDAGSYAFVCTIHEDVTDTLHLR